MVYWLIFIVIAAINLFFQIFEGSQAAVGGPGSVAGAGVGGPSSVQSQSGGSVGGGGGAGQAVGPGGGTTGGDGQVCIFIHLLWRGIKKLINTHSFGKINYNDN